MSLSGCSGMVVVTSCRWRRPSEAMTWFSGPPQRCSASADGGADAPPPRKRRFRHGGWDRGRPFDGERSEGFEWAGVGGGPPLLSPADLVFLRCCCSWTGRPTGASGVWLRGQARYGSQDSRGGCRTVRARLRSPAAVPGAGRGDLGGDVQPKVYGVAGRLITVLMGPGEAPAAPVHAKPPVRWHRSATAQAVVHPTIDPPYGPVVTTGS